MCLGVSCVHVCVNVGSILSTRLSEHKHAHTKRVRERGREGVSKREREFCIREGWVFSSRGAELQSRQPGATAAALSVSPSASPPHACIPFWTRHPVQWNSLRARSCVCGCVSARARLCVIRGANKTQQLEKGDTTNEGAKEGVQSVAWSRGVCAFLHGGATLGCGVWRTQRDAVSSGISRQLRTEPLSLLPPSPLLPSIAALSSLRPFAETGESAPHGSFCSLSLASYTGIWHNQVCTAAKPCQALETCLHGVGILTVWLHPGSSCCLPPLPQWPCQWTDETLFENYANRWHHLDVTEVKIFFKMQGVDDTVNRIVVYATIPIWFKQCRFYKRPIALILTFPHVVLHNRNACEQCCCFTLSKRDETGSRHASQRNDNILIYEWRQSVVMLAGFLGLRADISLLGNRLHRLEERRRNVAEDGREGKMIWGCTHPHMLSPPTGVLRSTHIAANVCLKAIMHGGMHGAHVCVHTWLHTYAHRDVHTHMCTNPHSTIIHNHDSEDMT